MGIVRMRVAAVLAVVIVGGAIGQAQAQTPPQSTSKLSHWVVDFGIGIDPSINGNVNSGVIGHLQGQATAILPQSYGDVYGTGIQLRFGGGYVWDEMTEIRGMFIFQSADADLVRLGDLGPSPLYGQYADYKSFGLDLGVRRYVPFSTHNFRLYGEATLGASFVDAIDVQFAAPQSNIVFTDTDFYDSSAAFTWTLGAGVLFPIADHVDINAAFGLRHVGGLPAIGPLEGTDLQSINNDSSRLTFPIVVGLRLAFR